MQPLSLRSLALVSLLVSPVPGRAGDWPQFLGPARDSHARGQTDLLTDVPADGFPILWKADCGAGFAGPVVKDGKVVLFHRMGAQNVVQAFEARSGRELWKTAWETDYEDDFGFDEGPRSCPTLAGDGERAAAYCYGADGSLVSLSLASGKINWRKDLVKELKSGKGFFGRACAPLVTEKLVIVAAGGTDGCAAAFERESGKLAWKSAGGEAGYASPVLMTPGQGARAVFFTREGVVGLNPDSGSLAWSAPFRSRTHASVNAASPVVVDATHFFTSACYETGAALWEIGADDTIKTVWRTHDQLDCHYSTPVLVNDFLYGFHGRQESGQQLRCISAKDGTVKWSRPLAPGQVIAAGDRLVILTEDGEVVLTGATPADAPSLTVRSEVLRSGHRAPPALADGLLYARDKSRLVCVDLRAKK